MPHTAPSTPNDRSPEYILGTNAAELERLGLQHQLWSAQAHELWERAGIGPGSSVLDIGCGPGFAAMDLAQLVGSAGRIDGVDESPGFVTSFNEQAAARGFANAHAHVSDVTRLDGVEPISGARYDAAYARWIFCFVPHPEQIIGSLLPLLRPGGRLIVQDYFNYGAMTSAPRLDSVTQVVRATQEAWRMRGGNPDVMGIVPRIATEAGMTIEHLDVRQRIARPHTPLWQWPRTFWRNFMPVLQGLNLVSDSLARQFFDDFDAMERTDHAYIVLPTVFDLIVRKPG